MNRKILLIDIDKCTGCKVCMEACSIIHDGVFSPTLSRIHIMKVENKGLSIPSICEHCETNPPCQAVCPVKAINRDEKSGAVIINLEKCTGCRFCKWICPWGQETILIRNKKAYKCDLCNGDPYCVKFCTSKALEFLELNESTKKRKWELAEKRAREIVTLEVRKHA